MKSFGLNTGESMLAADVMPSAWTGHLPFAFWLVEAMQPTTLVELGTHHGTSFLGFCQAMARTNRAVRAYAVDTWAGDEHAGFYGQEVHDRLQALVQSKYGGFAQLLRMRFDEALAYFANGSVDLLHIDGLHTYEAVRDDFESWLPKMSARGVVVFHDINVRERGFGVWKLWDELRGRYPSFGFTHTHGLGVLLVGGVQPEPLRALCDAEDEAAAIDRLFDALGQRITYRDRAEDLAPRLEESQKLLHHYRVVGERAEAAAQASSEELAGARAHASEVEGRLEEAQQQLQHSRAIGERAEQAVQSTSRELGEAQELLQRSRLAGERAEAAARLASEELEAALASRADVESRLAGLAAALESSQREARDMRSLATARAAELAERDMRLMDANARIELARGQLQLIRGSSSWRLTAWVRWLRASLAAAVRGRRPPALSGMLQVALPERVHAPALAGPDASAATTPSGAERQYLQHHFASDADRRASEFVEASQAAPPVATRAKAIAFYLPQFHPFPENEAWWGKGFTEWTNVTKAVPQFLGHHQPQLPLDLGFYDLRLPDVIRRQVEMARQYGLHGFAFHYYWFAGKRLMEAPLETYLAQEDIDFPFCLCWANENWTRRWDGHDSDVLISQEHGPDNDLAFIRDLERYLRDPRYIRLDGKPLVIVYRPSILPDPRATLRRWRDYCRDVGIGELHLAMAQFDVEDPREFGFDSAMEFPPHKLGRGFEAINDSLDIVNPDYQGHVLHYQSIVDSARNWPDGGFPLIRTVFPGWDNEARRPGRGYTFAWSTPGRYREWLGFAVDYAEANPVAGERVVMINAWNEWAEGAHLEPDRRFGHAYLQATREVLEARQPAGASTPPRRIAVVSHDAHPHGAQYLALNLCRELHAMGFLVDAVLLGGGVLEDDFRRVATVHRLDDPRGDAGRELATRLHRDGHRHAIANTAVSGSFVPALARAGLSVVSLVHELPGVIRSYGLQQHVDEIASASRRVVFAAEAVRDGFVPSEPLPPGKAVIRAQGLYKRNRCRADIPAARARLRRDLSLGGDARVMLGVGYADLRKGIDLFVEAAARLAMDDERLHAVWIGHFDLELEPAIRQRVASLGLAHRIHFPGRVQDTDPWYAGADLLALTSREDPFPSVVMEALDVGVPVIAFAGTGGASELLSRGGGLLVDRIDADAFASACASLLADEASRARLGAAGQALVDAEFSFRRYVFDLLDHAGQVLPRVSVVVPNYNYGHLLEARLHSILAQTLPPFEVVVLDDASTDASLDCLAPLAREHGLAVVAGASNSGSVFRQWAKGVAMTHGDFVWIAEADDLSEPGFLEEALRGFDDPSVVLSYTQSRQIGMDGETLAPDYLDYTADICPDRWRHAYVAGAADELAHGFGVKNTIPNASAVVFRREPLLDVLARHLEDAAAFRIAGDWVVYLRMLERGKVAYSPRALNQHRRHGGSVTLGSAQAPHLREVIQVQSLAERLFGRDQARRKAAAAYLRHLYRHFGFDDEGGTDINADPRFNDLLEADGAGRATS